MRFCGRHKILFGPRANYKYLYDLDASAVELYFGNTEFTFVIILPNNRTGLSDLEAKLKDYDLKYIMKSTKYNAPNITIPKFEIEFDIGFNEILQNVCTVYICIMIGVEL